MFTKVITARISDTLDFNESRQQAGFRSEFSTTDYLHTVTQIRENIVEFRKPLFMAFIDYERVFDKETETKAMFNSRVHFEQIHVQGETLEVVVHPPSYGLWIRNMDHNPISGEETNKCTERDGKAELA
ncbi:uncharacterized protein LOC119575908 [Penaeus monodon]|uniref:uncharacterized protein LOC119575908 n=1 Tax=Penaeus monodon TaxID=6687 RepID=UPI0018A6EB4A|nr:uncharacterized protein LOC119575908 [Penaeus monodon]